MLNRFHSIFRHPASGGLPLADLFVIFTIVSLIAAILYPVFAHG